MDGAGSRRKGQVGQRECKAAFEAHGMPAKVTASMQSADDQTFADVTAQCGDLRLAVEVKHTKSLPSVGTMKAIAQVDEAEPGSPNVARAVAMRIQGEPKRFIFAMRDTEFFGLLGRLQPAGESCK